MVEFFLVLRKLLNEICDHAQKKGFTFPRRPWGRYVTEAQGESLLVRLDKIDSRPNIDSLSTLIMGMSLEKGETFNKLMEAIERSEKLSQIFFTDAAGQFVERDKESWAFSKILPIVNSYFLEVNEFVFQKEVFQMVSGVVEAEIKRFPFWRKILKCPLVGVHLPRDLKLVLVEDLCLRAVTSEEMEDFNNSPVYPKYPAFTALLEMGKEVEVFAQTLFLPEERKKVKDAIIALRLFSGERIFMPWEVEKYTEILGKTFPGNQISQSLEQRIVPFPTRVCILDKNKCMEIEGIYQQLSGVTLSEERKRRVERSLHKWNEALDQVSDEESLIANWIALETLFSPSDRDELSFRLALRGGVFLGQKKIYKDLRESYKIRSKIVHGGTIKNTQIGQVALRTREILRQILLKILRDPESYAPDEDQLEEKLLGYLRE